MDRQLVDTNFDGPSTFGLPNVHRCYARAKLRYETSVFSGRCNVLAGFEDAGIYSTITSDTVDPSKGNKRAASIWTNVFAMCMYSDRVGAPILPTDIKYARSVYQAAKSLSGCPKTLLHVDDQRYLSEHLFTQKFNDGVSHREVLPALDLVHSSNALLRS